MNKEVNPVFAWGIIIVVLIVAVFLVERQVGALNADVEAISTTQATMRPPAQIGSAAFIKAPATSTSVTTK